MINAAEVVAEAAKGALIGIPYSKLDCQALVERLLKNAGVVNVYGVPYNWRGSNDIWRNAVHDRTKITSENREQIPAGAFVFTIKNDGGEKARGYNDDMKNAAHIGFYLGNGKVQHSTTGGVQWDNISSSRWTHYALSNDLEYTKNLTNTRECGYNCSKCWQDVILSSFNKQTEV